MSSIRSRKHTVNPYALALAATALTFPLAAMADAPADGPTEVLVKGERVHYKAESANRKATASLLDTPQTVQVITDEIISEQGATTLTEALRNSPGVGTFYLGENGSTSTGDAIFMRGTDSSGSIFIDGVRDVASISRDTFNIQQVEVLKGAAGADIGRGSATGAINLVTKRPFLKNAYSGTLAVGEGDYARGTADLNWKVGEHTALRLNLLDQDAGVNGRDRTKNKRWGVAPTLGFGLQTPTRLYLGYIHIEQNNIPDGGVLTIGLPGYSSPDPVNRPYVSNAAPVDPANWYGTRDDHDDITSDTLSAIFEHDFSDALSIVNVTRWSETDQNYQLSSFMAGTTQLVTPDANDPSTWTITRNINNKDATNKVMTNQTNLRVRFHTGGLEHNLSSGVEFIREDVLNRTYAGTGAYPPVSVYNPDPDASGYSRALSGARTALRTDTAAIYVNDTVEFNKYLQATAGLRLDHYKTRYDSVAATGVSAPTINGEKDIVSGKFGVVYKPVHNGSVYVSYAVTKQPPSGTAAAGTTNANNPDVEPQEAKTSEAGTKWGLLGNHLTLSGAVYRTEYSDTVAVDDEGNYYHTGQKSVQGVELGAIGQITPNWNISTGYTTMKTKTTLAPVAADGSQLLAYNPSDSFTLWTTYVLPHGLTFGGGATYNGEMKRGKDGAVGTPAVIKSYVVYNGLAKYRINEKVELQLNIYNLFDREYVASINKSGYRYTPGLPRTFRLTANVNF